MNLLINFWTFDLVSGLIIAGLGLIYGFLSGWRLRPGAGLYFLGLFLVAFVQTSPLHYLGMYYLLSANMVGHMLLLLVAAPLMVLGLPRQTDARTPNTLESHLPVFSAETVGWLAALSGYYVVLAHSSGA